MMMPKPGEVVSIDPALLAEEPDFQKKLAPNAPPAEKLEESRILSWIVSGLGFAYLVYYFSTKGFNITINTVNLIFLIAGMFIDPNSAMLILIPPLFPVSQMLGIDPVHFGMIVTLNISLGMITPPFGLDIFVTASTLKLPVLSVMRGVTPFIVVNLIVLLIVTYVPAISLFIPRLMFGG